MLVLAVGNHSSRSLNLYGLALFSSVIKEVDINSVDPGAPTVSSVMTPARWYFLSVASFVIPMGIQTVLFPWLLAIELQLGARELGLGQMALQIPALFLILIGGFLADRLDARKMLISLHLIAILPPLTLALFISNDVLSFALMIAYALSMGVVTAFSQPARDKLLSAIAGDQIQRTVTIAMGLTFGAQIFGFGIASLAEVAGAELLLVVMAAILLSGIYASFKLPASPGNSDKSSSMRKSIAEGLRIVFESEKMRASAIMLATLSVFYGGTFMVLNPLIVRDVYQGGATEISLSFACFMSGTVLTSVVLVTLGGLKNPGLGMILAASIAGLMLGITALGLPFMGYLAVLFAWGCCGGLAMSMGRTIMQELAPESHRARVLSVLSLANVGALPFGAALMGFCAEYLGILNSFLVAVAGVWLITAYVATRTRLAYLDLDT
ncbi:MAG: MFS family permease [Candidatus Azotimanducaceae bacterium]